MHNLSAFELERRQSVFLAYELLVFLTERAEYADEHELEIIDRQLVRVRAHLHGLRKADA